MRRGRLLSPAILVGCWVVACGNGEAGEPVLFVEGRNQEASPLGVWCVTRSGSNLDVVPVAPEDTDARWGNVLMLGEQPWLFYRYRGFERSFAAPIDACELGDSVEVPRTELRWSNASPCFLAIDDLGGLAFGAPGAESVVVEPSGVTSLAWSPARDTAWYMRAESLDASLGELFVLESEPSEPDSDLDPSTTFVSDDVLDAVWTPDAEQLVFTTVGEAGVTLHTWSRSIGATVLAEYPNRTSIDITPGPNSRALLVYLRDSPEQYRLVSLDDGEKHLLVEDGFPSRVRWLWPESWLQYEPFEGEASLFDVTDVGSVTATVVGAPLYRLSPERGIAVQTPGTEPARLVSGLPGNADLVRDLPDFGAGWFSPDGQYWAAIDFAARDDGSVNDHGGLLLVAETKADGADWLVTDLGGRLSSLDGIRWLDSQSFVLMLSEAGGTNSIALVEYSGGSWRRTERPLPGQGSSRARLFMLDADPCQAIPIAPHFVVPGCASPWR